MELMCELVYNGFYLYCLLLDFSEHNMFVCLPHNGSMNERICYGLRIQNKFMAGTGQEHWNHACNVCCVFEEAEERDGNDSAASDRSMSEHLS
jgi:hypothetical protein